MPPSGPTPPRAVDVRADEAIRRLPDAVLAEWLGRHRWFAAGGGPVLRVEVPVVVPLPGCDDLAVAIVAAVLAGGTRQLYQVPLAVGEAGRLLDPVAFLGDLAIGDALADPATGPAFARFLLSGGRTAGTGGAVAVTAPPGGGVPRAAATRALPVHQTHSSIVLDEHLLVKAYRRLAPGPGPELEMIGFLTRHGFESVPPLRGWYSLESRALDATLGITQEFIRGATDGWTRAQDLLGGPPGALAGEIARLGAALGRMHAVLACDPLDPDFAPIRKDPIEMEIVVATVDDELRGMFAAHGDDDRLEPLRGCEAELRALVAERASVEDLGMAIRVHGDMHLGQAIVDPDGGWWIIDFEGEPLRPTRERRRHRSPLRDLAGLLGSIAYACSVARRSGRDVPDEAEAEVRAALLHGYFTAVDPALLPAGDRGVEALLDLYAIEKLVYELRYELAYRPDWVGIPVAGLIGVLATA